MIFVVLFLSQFSIMVILNEPKFGTDPVLAGTSWSMTLHTCSSLNNPKLH